MFGPKFARHVASRYRKRGLDKTAQRMVDWLVSQGIDDATVLEIGGGVGEIQIELLRRGASHATNFELSTSYDEDAGALADEAGVADRTVRRIGDIAADGAAADIADVAVMHRVICCYPDADRLLGAAADHARRMVVLSHPPGHLVARAVAAVENLGLRVMGREYRAFAHRPEDLLATLRDRGFTAQHLHRGLVWHIIVATR